METGRTTTNIALARLSLLTSIGVREGILLGGRKKFALKITICPKNKQYAPKLTFLF